MHMPANNAVDFTPPPAGTFLAVSYRLIDLGTQPVVWEGKTKYQRKVMFSWELPEEKMDDGQPFSIHQRYTFSSSDKSRLRHDLESWRGVPFKDSDFGPNGFDIKNTLGKGCMLGIVHNVKGDRTYANITAVMKMPKGMAAPAPVNPIVYLSLERDRFNREVFDALSDGLRAVIAKSPEYMELTTGRHSGDAVPPPSDDDMNDSIPF